MADRVAQAALKLVLEPIFEADFVPVSYGFRPLRRAATGALARNGKRLLGSGAATTEYCQSGEEQPDRTQSQVGALG